MRLGYESDVEQFEFCNSAITPSQPNNKHMTFDSLKYNRTIERLRLTSSLCSPFCIFVIIVSSQHCWERYSHDHKRTESRVYPTNQAVGKRPFKQQHKKKRKQWNKTCYIETPRNAKTLHCSWTMLYHIVFPTSSLFFTLCWVHLYFWTLQTAFGLVNIDARLLDHVCSTISFSIDSFIFCLFCWFSICFSPPCPPRVFSAPNPVICVTYAYASPSPCFIPFLS